MRSTVVKRAVKSMSNAHRPDGRPNVFLFSTPRSGSTWLMELIWSQPGFKTCNQPLSLFNPLVRSHLGMDDWTELYAADVIEKLGPYFQAFCDGQLGFTNPKPFRRHYRPLTHRIVFKEIHGCADLINWFRDTFNARVAYLLRHPIAVTVSSERFPMLDAFLDTPYRRHLSGSQLVSAERIRASGSELDRGVLSWCLQNLVPLRDVTDDWAIVTYEQLVSDPDPVIDVLARKLELPEPGRMRRSLTVPSVNVRFKSTEETRRMLQEGDPEMRPHLIDKWRKRVDKAEEGRAMAILELFDLDVYRAGDALPAEWAWIPRPPLAEVARTETLG